MSKKDSNGDFEFGKKALAKRSPALRALLKRHRVVFEPQAKRDPFESLVRAIAHQQLHGKAAETILNRMLSLFPKGRFPSAKGILSRSVEELRNCGFSASKVKSIVDIAEKKVSGVVPNARDMEKLSNEEIIERLTAIYGVGRWTVEMLLIFQLGRLDIWPADDFGVRRGYQVWKRKRSMPTPKELRLVSEEFAPYQTIVALHLWREADLAKLKAKST